MRFLRDLFQSIREAFRPAPEPDWTAIADRSNWPVNTTRSRWVAA